MPYVETDAPGNARRAAEGREQSEHLTQQLRRVLAENAKLRVEVAHLRAELERHHLPVRVEHDVHLSFDGRCC